MTTFKPGDRVIVTIDGHDTEWTVTDEWSGCAGAKPTVSRPGMHLNVDVGSLRPVPMEEPTKFGAMVEDDFGLLVRIYDPSYRALGKSAWIRHNVSFQQTYRWSELKNPRPYTGGDE